MSLDVAALYGTEHDRLVAYFRKRLEPRDPSVAEDLAAAVWLRVWEKRDRYRPLPGTPARAWLYGIARNLLVDYLRHEPRGTSLDMLVGLMLEPSEPSRTSAVEWRIVLSDAVETLRPRERAVVVGQFWDGRLQREMSEIGTTYGVKSLQARALVRLRRALGVAA